MSKHTLESPAFAVGDQVVALVTMTNDLTADGLGVQLCANKGNVLIVRNVSFGYMNCIAVSHKHITDRSFCVSPNEISAIAEETGDQS